MYDLPQKTFSNMATPASALSPDTSQTRKAFIRLAVACGVILAGAIFFGAYRSWPGLQLSVTPQNIGTLLAPIAFAAAVVERAVEVLVSPWRDAGANNLKNEIAAIKARISASSPVSQQDQNELREKSRELEGYRGITQRYAFVVSITLSTFVSIAGFRALQPFLATSDFDIGGPAKPGQQGFFYLVDVMLTAMVLAGGADGVHSIVNAVTTFFDSTASKTASN